MEFKPLLESFAKDVGFSRYQLDSFNDFVENRLQRIIDETKQIKPEVPEVGELVIRLGKARVGEPTVKEADGSLRKILPLEARLRDMTYSAPIFVEMTPVINKKEQNMVEVQVGELPIMVMSEVCPLSKMTREEREEAGEDPDDNGGYFIVNGNERVLVLIEELAQNRMILEKKEGAYSFSIRINSERNGFTQRHVIEKKNDGSIVASFANVKRLPAFVLLKVLGIETDKEITEALVSGLPEELQEAVAAEVYSNLYSVDVASAADAVEYIGRHMKVMQKEYVKDRVEQVVNKYFLPHIGQENKNRKEKAQYFAKVLQKLILLSLGKIPPDDLDHYGNKRLRMSGDLLEMLFRSILIGKWGLIARVSYNYQKLAKRGKLPSIQTVVESNVVSNQLTSAMATGAWVGGRTGISQRLERENIIATVSHLRNIISPLTSTQEHFEARELHPTQFGRLCPAETPEGPTIGLRKALASLAQITGSLPDSEKEKLVAGLKLVTNGKISANQKQSSSSAAAKKADDIATQALSCVYVDGVLSGVCENPEKFSADFRNRRRNGLVSTDANIAYYPQQNEIVINTDSGRVRRPLIIVENGAPKMRQEHLNRIKSGEMSWNDLVKSGIIEYLDAEEEENATIAVDGSALAPGARYTHLEISPFAMLGLSASTIPFPEHNRGDRVNYGAKMAKQSIGLFASNFALRSDTKSDMLIYPQPPIVESFSTETMNLLSHPAGQNVVIAVITHHGYNMQDAIVVNKSSVDRGMFRSEFFRFYKGEEKRYYGGQEDLIGIPDKDVRGYRSEDSYKDLAEDGIANPETKVEGNSVLVGRTSPLRFLSSAAELMTGIANKRETSVCVRHAEGGKTDRIFLTETANGSKFVKVSVRDERIPEIGDKFATRHGQKGVIGLLVSEEDMPFTSRGIVPDVLFNPHSFPSRQTIGQLLETLSGKVAALSGRKINASAFSNISERELREKLREFGFRSDGKEVMYSGTTGEKMEVEIFTGVIYYLKLFHMVANKIQARSRGPVALLTKQPTEGRAKEGGLRLGEMEKDVMIAHGAALALKERFSSDRTVVSICKNCGLIAFFDSAKNKNVCPVCKDSETEEVEMAYAFKLMLDELKTMGIYPKVNVGE